MTGAWSRIYALWLRHVYILSRSVPRLLEIMYWPSVQMIMWGFVSRFFAMGGNGNMTSLDVALGTLLGAVLLWDVLFRTQIGLSISYLEEIWARNMGHLFVSPLRPYEWVSALMLVSLARALIGIVPAALLAIPFYGFSIFDLGLPLLLFFFNLVLMGWWLGLLITAMLIKAGPGAESLAWMTTFALAPFCAVYYPPDVLPHWMQMVSDGLPAAHVFNGLRALVADGTFLADKMAWAFGLNIMYMAIGFGVLQWAFNDARKHGTLLQAGE